MVLPVAFLNGLDEIDPAVQKGSFGEFTGSREACAVRQYEFQDSV